MICICINFLENYVLSRLDHSLLKLYILMEYLELKTPGLVMCSWKESKGLPQVSFTCGGIH